MKSCGYAISLGIMAVLCLSCDHDDYLITMEARDDSMHRQITGWTQHSTGAASPQSQLAPGKLRSLENAYSTRLSKPGEVRQTFAGAFSGKLPGELDGAGEYRTFRTQMGSVTLYVERFKGGDDLGEHMAGLLKSADAIAEILKGWFSEHLGKEKEFPKLKDFLDQNLRKDIKNLANLPVHVRQRPGDRQRQQAGNRRPSGFVPHGTRVCRRR
ncbi:MAG: hypothetical protein ABFD92_05505 [Planctomycetaceae bacterium]|nr:hypothetical protein [Planctomycetaceae bacterium]